jgi:signal transduction histidine kinase
MIDNLAQTKKENIKQQQKLVNQNKLAAMGKLLEQIAHQWRQPLNVISAINGGLKHKIKNDRYEKDKFLDKLSKAEDTTSYLSSTIDDFMSFYKQDRIKEKIQLYKIIQTQINILTPLLKKQNINLIYNIKSHLKTISFENQLSHVIFNFLTNSLEILKTIDSDRFIFIDIDENEKNIIIDIKDNAGGVKKEDIEHIFEPYFTTKDGTGLGLFMNYTIIKKHLHGEIEFKNKNFLYEKQKLKGANFIIYLPK